ncbi:GNAT family N-acetyltransferase [Metabacillus litoralis]|uniref:GNAT family N-acetyltransferase n=1 Tax=Metabacillus litoralis TaxID=152268 RepID=A0A5C6V908_9BACI|nr:GNAT family N-acetyltransferase [Metabacillus litoralis]TXC81893.1 GNAT family N-acetyltransferase [Metabacillus litoralis]
MYSIETPRLGFLPMTFEALEAAIYGEEKLQHFLGLKIIKGFIEPVHNERVFPIRLDKLRKDPELSKWYGFVVEKNSETVVGMMGYKNPPNEKGLIEIGYGITSQFQGMGYASEMAQKLMEWAFQQEGVKGITATNKIVKKLGMVLLKSNNETVDYIVYK